MWMGGEYLCMETVTGTGRDTLHRELINICACAPASAQRSQRRSARKTFADYSAQVVYSSSKASASNNDFYSSGLTQFIA